MRIALGLEYGGSGYTGWQSQADGRGVQDVVERALGAIAGVPIRTVAAGRTDTGVHATMQIVHFDCGVTRPDSAWVRGVNAHLPREVAVLWAQPVAAEFHARNKALARHYTYVLCARAVRPALLADRVGWYHRALDVEAMQEAARALAGTHDFSAFRAAECQAKSASRTLAAIVIAADGDAIHFDFAADAFLHRMIRNIMGALVYVGSGKKRPGWVAEVLAGRDRTRAAPTFAPDGLYFTGADYDGAWRLPATRRPVALPLA
jgi:tRNA pseudouridine38-40 synthase